VPDIVLAQLGNRVQHALRAFTPRDTKAVKAAADTFRPNPEFSAFDAITQLGVGEALVSTLEDKGVPSIVQRTLMRPPSSRIGTISEEERKRIIAASPIGTLYDKTVDRESAFEVLSMRVETKTSVEVAAADEPAASEPEEAGGIGGMIGSIFGTSRPRGKRLTTGQRVARSVTRTVTTRVVGGVAAEVGKKFGGSLGGSVGRAIVRGVLGGILRS
jgi:hypothetical protein